MDFTIRAMELKDIEKVAEIEKSIFSIPWSADSFADASADENNIYLVCSVNGEIAGYCGMWTVFGEGNITNVAVAEKFRGKGYGKALLEELEKRARQKEVNIFFLEVRESNVVAQKLYESMDYKNIGVRRNFYERPPENAIVMSKIYTA